MDSADTLPADGTPDATGDGSRSGFARLITWVLLIAALAVLAMLVLASRGSEKIDSPAFSLTLPQGFSQSKTAAGTYGINNGDGATVILLPKPKNPPLTAARAKLKLQRLSCGAMPSIANVGKNRVVVATATRNCGNFQSTALISGQKNRVLLACSGKTPRAASAACNATLENITVK